MASTGSPIVDDLVNSTVGKVKKVWNKVTGGSDNDADDAKPAPSKQTADPGMLKEANDSFKPQTVGKKAATKQAPVVSKPTTVAAKAAPRKKL